MASTGNTKKILTVDDEDHIRFLIQAALTQFGYQVDVAASGEEALSMLADNQYDLMVTDFRMPGMTGTTLYERQKLEFPESAKRVIFITGEVLNNELSETLEQSGCLKLNKPFSMAELVSIIRDHQTQSSL